MKKLVLKALILCVRVDELLANNREFVFEFLYDVVEIRDGGVEVMLWWSWCRRIHSRWTVKTEAVA